MAPLRWKIGGWIISSPAFFLPEESIQQWGLVSIFDVTRICSVEN